MNQRHRYDFLLAALAIAVITAGTFGSALQAADSAPITTKTLLGRDDRSGRHG